MLSIGLQSPVIPAMLLQTMFNAGLCMMVARWTAASQDVTQLIPFVMTTWRYLSGVFYSIYVFTESAPPDHSSGEFIPARAWGGGKLRLRARAASPRLSCGCSRERGRG